MKPTFQRMLIIIGISGACSLVYQVAWLRLMRLIFGSSTAASAAVVAIFMGGLGVGGWYFGRRTHSMDNPLKVYSRLEYGIAAAAALSPFLVWVARSVYLELGGVFSLGLATASLVRLTLATLVLGVPTALMGGTLPVVTQALEREEDAGRRRLAWLYGINTFGAVLGACLANFYLLEHLGIRKTLWLGAAVNLLLAFVAGALARKGAGSDAEAPSEAPSGSQPQSDSKAETSPGSRDPSSLEPVPTQGSTVALGGLERQGLFAIAALVGCAFFLMELVWYRMLASILGGSTYTMGLILAMALLGIAVGGLLYALGGEHRRPTLYTLAATCGLEGLFLSLPLLLGDDLALFASRIRDLAILGFGGLVFSWSVVVAIIVLPAALVAGYQFPVLVGLLGRGRENAGRDVGQAYAWNTGGAILGSLAGGFGLIPLLGAPMVWRLTTVLLAATALMLSILPAALAGSKVSGARGTVWLTAISALFVVVVAEGPSAFWRHVPIGAGRATVDIYGTNGYQAYRREVQWATRQEADGIESSIALQVISDSALIVNGKSDGAALGDAATTLMSGLVGAALHEDPRHVLVIGLGIGTTAGWFTTVDSIETVDVVELEPTVVELTRPLGPATFHVLDSPKTRMHLGDGREMVLTQKQTWDLIFSEPSNPYRAGVADLFSRDFYRAARQRLAPGGLFLQWLQGYEVDAQLMQTVFATLSSEFETVETWQVGRGDLLLVASNGTIEHNYPRIEERMALAAYADGMRKVWGVEGIAGLYSGFVGGPKLAEALSQAAEPSSDDQPRIEFGFARKVGRPRFAPIRDLRSAARRLDANRPAGIDPQLWLESQELLRLRTAQGSASDPDLMRNPTVRDRARQEFSKGRQRAAIDQWASQDQPPTAYRDKLMMAYAYADTGSELYMPMLVEVELYDPASAAAITARFHWRQGNVDQAVTSVLKAISYLRSDPWFDYPVAHSLPELAIEVARTHPDVATRLYDALAEPFSIRMLDQPRLLAQLRLLINLPDFKDRCRPFFDQLQPNVFWLSSFLEARFRCLQLNEDPEVESALEELELFIAQDPQSFVVPLP